MKRVHYLMIVLFSTIVMGCSSGAISSISSDCPHGHDHVKMPNCIHA